MVGLPGEPSTSATTTSDAQSPTLENMDTANDASMLSCDEIVEIDPDGDLLLYTKPDPGLGGRFRFRVCSAALRRHSPVWKAMLFGPWKESKPADDSEWAVEFPEDLAYEFQIVLNIIHGLVDRVPSSLDIDTFFKLLILVNKYDIAHIMKPWCTTWETPALSSLVGHDVLKGLYIARELGYKDLFIFRLAQIAVNTWVEGDFLVFRDSSIMDLDGIILQDEDDLGPTDVLDVICNIRKAVIEKMVAPLNEDLEALVNSTPRCTFKSDHHTRTRRLCDAAVLGSIHRGMIQRRGSILPRESSCITESVVHLASELFPMMDEIQTIEFHSTKCSLKDKYRKHNSTLHDSVITIAREFLTPRHLVYMALQRSKTGLENQCAHSTERYW
ncbi:uncharacterized protein B0T23DRAFT_407201 [Neurospora hispaniola]|uniref:BTB domain-containing protein n=1 Tax=Neurospora hispaniola TaxID=588809 RepID=A0AAJ0I293_9PEZI|nr:hypothetical protein B0T23DRAFT_407201 [Neurospora hispaniola]